MYCATRRRSSCSDKSGAARQPIRHGSKIEGSNQLLGNQRLASEACLRALPWVRCNLHQATVRYRSNHCAAQYSSAGEPASAALPRERYVSGVRRLEPVRIVFPTKQLLVVGPLLWYLCKTFSWMGDQENRFGGHSARKSCRRVNPNDPHFCVGGNDGTEVRHNQTIF
jgi:hypothetical protein